MKEMGAHVIFEELLSRFFVVFTTLFVIIDPIGVLPTFISLTKGYSEQERRRIILKGVIAGAVVLVAFSLFGKYLFHFLGLNLSAFQTGGGILLLLTALEMLKGQGENCRCSKAELSSGLDREDISFVPIAVPLLSGPGAITSVMVFSTDHNSSHFIHFSILSLAVVLCFVLSYLVLRGSSLVLRVLGASGSSVVQRLMGLILAALSIQLIADGAFSLFEALKKV